MKQTVYVFLFVIALYTGAAQGQEMGDFTTSVQDLENNPFRLPVFKDKKGFLESEKIAIGTILRSHHFNNENYNESHNGFYVSIEKWSAGSYKNSGNVHSAFVAYNPKIYSSKSYVVNLIAGVADGYEGWNYAQGDYLPIMGISAKWMSVRTMLSYDFVSVGFELPLN